MPRKDARIERADLAQQAIALRAQGREWPSIVTALGVPAWKLDRAVRTACADRPAADLAVWRETETVHLMSVRRVALDSLGAAQLAEDWRAVAALVRSLADVSRSLQRLLGLEQQAPAVGNQQTVNVINVPSDRLSPPTLVPGQNWFPPGAAEVTIGPDDRTVDG